LRVVEVFKDILSMESITPKDGGTLEYIQKYLSDFESEYFRKNGVSNLFLKKKFGEGIHLCLAGHVDVVPPGEGWKYPPFEAVEMNGYIYGRGSQDMKSGVASMVQALNEIDHFPGTLSLLLTSDEEGDAKFGTLMVLEELAKRGELPDYALITEPTSEEVMGDVVKVGRRGSINGTITIQGKQGHVAYPQKSINPIHLIANRLPKIAGYQFDSGDDFFAPSQLVITDIRGGLEVTNVTPDNVKIMFNVRNSTKTALEDVEEHIREVFDGLNYTLSISQSSKPFLTDSNSLIVEIVRESVEKVCNTTPQLTTGGGTSDARFFAQYGIKVVEFGVMNDRIHSIDERTSIDEVEKLYRTIKTILKSEKWISG